MMAEPELIHPRVAGAATDLTTHREQQRQGPGLTQEQASDPNIAYFLEASIAPNTIRAYKSDIQAFVRWGGTIPASPQQVASYLASQAASLSPYTLSRRLSAIRRVHRALNLSDPGRNELVSGVMRGIWRRVGRAQQPARPLLYRELILLNFPPTLKGSRDRALILTGFRAALRRSELVGLNVEDFAFCEEGVLLTLRRSKTDQQGYGRTLAIPHTHSPSCAVLALRDWLFLSKLTCGPVFRSLTAGGVLKQRLSGHAVNFIVRHYAHAAGLETALLSAHSLRAGFVTSAAKAGSPVESIQRQTGHKSIEMLYHYVRASDPFSTNANQDLDR